MKTTVCDICGGMVVDGKQKYHHSKRCAVYTQEGVDHLRCRECGYRTSILSQHIKLHGMDERMYLDKYPGSILVLRSIVEKQSVSKTGKFKKIEDRSDAVTCKKCGQCYLQRFAAAHLSECVASHSEKYIEGQDYVKCPECGKAMTRLGEHLKKVHSWDEDRIAIEVGRGLKLIAGKIVVKRAESVDFEAAQEKREQTHLERHGFANPFSNPAIQEKIVETNQRRYGSDHPMQTEEVFIRQQDSAQHGLSALEIFFDDHTCDNVVYVGYGGRFIRTKTGVHKYGKIGKDLNPDFIILSDNVLESALSASKERRKLDNLKHRSRYVIELLGDYYHSEQVIGVKPEDHEREIIEAYKSAGIECLVLWEKDVMGRWESIRSMVEAWISKAMSDMNERPIFSRAIKSKVDRRKGDLVCPCGSGKVFKSRGRMEKWMVSPLNYWRVGMEEGRDYVVCLECGLRVAKVTEHIRKSHGMTKEAYLEKYPGSQMVKKA